MPSVSSSPPPLYSFSSSSSTSSDQIKNFKGILNYFHSFLWLLGCRRRHRRCRCYCYFCWHGACTHPQMRATNTRLAITLLLRATVVWTLEHFNDQISNYWRCLSIYNIYIYIYLILSEPFHFPLRGGKLI